MSVARVRQRTVPGGTTALRTLLGADHFRLGPGATRVGANLAAHGGTADESAAAWIGDDLPPLGAPSVTLGAARGTLGPFSFGFLDNARGIAAYAAPLPVRPRRGSVAIVCGRRDALPDLAPLALARDLGVSWILSVGDGAPDEVLAFLATDEATRVVMLAADAKTRPAALGALAGKPVVVLGGEPLLRAAARRAGGVAVDDLESWLAHGALAEAGVVKPRRPAAVVIGGGAGMLEQAARSVGLDLPIRVLDDEDADALDRAMARGGAGEDDERPDLLLVAGTGTLPRSPLPSVALDLGHLDRVRAVLGAIVARQAPNAPAPAPAIDGQRAQAMAIVEAGAGELGDHDTKRVLKAYGVRVSRQAPANSATRAAQVAAQVGFPVDVVSGTHVQAGAHGRARLAREQRRRAPSASEARRAAAVALDDAPFVLVREAFPESGRVRLRVERERGVGDVCVVEGATTEQALLPLDGADASALARAATGSTTGDLSRAASEQIARIAAAAHDCGLSLDLELCVEAELVVVSAAASRA